MKKAYIYVLSFFLLAILFSGSYYISYKMALQQFNKNAKQEEINLLASAKEEKMADGQEIKEQALPADSIAKQIVMPDTKYILEIYDLKQNKEQRKELATPAFLIGLSREEIIDYLVSYMKDVPLDDFEKGLVSFEMVSFSDKEVVLRKTYNSDKVAYQYYVVVINGYVTVFYSDKKTIFEYTKIESANLSEQEQNRLIDGIYVKDQEELYGLLESYSS